MSTLTYSGTLVIKTCWCGIRHAIPSELARQAEHNGRAVYCPLGHEWVVKETEAEKLRKQLENEREYSARVVAARDQTEASLRATRGVVTKLKKRASAGVCPCCNRTFQNVARHMATKHPDFAEQNTGKEPSDA